MHNFRNNGNSVNYNSDLSGDVILRNKHGQELEISGEFLLEFIAGYVANQRISKLESATTKEILGI